MHHYNLRRMASESSSTQSTISIPSSDPSNSASSSTSQPMIVHTLPSLQFDMVNMDAFSTPLKLIMLPCNILMNSYILNYLNV